MGAMSIFKTKNILSFIGIGLVLVLVYIAWRVIFFGTGIIIIEGPHDPLTTQVTINNARLLPSGTEGRTYRYDGSVGSKKFKIAGPQIKTQNIDADIRSFSEVSKAVVVESLSLIDLAKGIVEADEIDNISESRLFGENNDWLVISISRPGVDDGRYFYIYFYESSEVKWKLIADGVKIDLVNEPSRKVPQELVEYMGIVSDD